jgi:hypothetical protein
LASASAWTQTGSAAPPSTQALNQQNANNLCRIYFEKVKPSNVSQFEQARQKHFQFHKSQGDTWTWMTREIISGPNTGTYVVSTCGHNWKEFDAWEEKMGKQDAADANASMGPYLEENQLRIYSYRSDLSLAPANQPPAQLTAVTVYRLKPGMSEQFTSVIRSINEALSRDAGRPKNSGWMELINGGEVPTFVVLTSRQNWSEYSPLDKTIREVVTAAYGKDQADALYKKLTDSTESIWTETAMLRTDLSYMPGK